MKVVHKPTVVDAVGWDGSDAAVAELRALGLEDCRFEPQGDGPPVLVIHTLEGERHVLIADVVIKGTRGEFYPVKPDVFAACYEPVMFEVGPITVTTGGTP